jgi:plastocyanin
MKSGRAEPDEPGIWPAGVTPVVSKFNQRVDFKIIKPGLYGIKCLPHLGMGMVALIKAGKGPASNATAAR